MYINFTLEFKAAVNWVAEIHVLYSFCAISGKLVNFSVHRTIFPQNRTGFFVVVVLFCCCCCCCCCCLKLHLHNLLDCLTGPKALMMRSLLEFYLFIIVITLFLLHEFFIILPSISALTTQFKIMVLFNLLSP